MRHGRDHLPPPFRVGPPVAALVEEDHRPIVGLDHPLEIRLKGSVCAPPRVIGPTHTPVDPSLATSLSDVEMLPFGAVLPVDTHAPAFGIGVAHAVQRLQSHGIP